MNTSDENKLKIVKEALRHTEIKIANLNLLATGAENKALHFATLTTAFGTVLAINAKNFPGPFTAYITAFMLILLSCFSVYQTLPKRFHVTGHYWADWKGHITDGDDFVDVLISQAEENDDRINFNYAILEKSAVRFRRCFNLLILIGCFFAGSQFGSGEWNI